jgi:hypothetical protein
VTENTRAGRRTVTYLKTETGQGASESEIPEEFKKPERNDGDDVEEEYDPTWVGLLPRDDTGLSGDARGGAWAITGDVVDIATGQSVFAFPDAVMNYAISRKGSWIATKSTEERILLWPFGAEALKKRACEILPRNLTVEEWKKFDLGQRRATCPNLP